MYYYIYAYQENNSGSPLCAVDLQLTDNDTASHSLTYEETASMPSLVKAGNLSDTTSVKEEGNLGRDSMTASMTTRVNLDTDGASSKELTYQRSDLPVRINDGMPV